VYNNNETTLKILIIIACLVAIVAGVLFINNSISVRCIDWWPFNAKTCTVGVK